MKKVFGIFLFAVIYGLFFISCTKDGSLSSIEEEVLSPDDFFDKVSNMNLKVDDDKVILFKSIWNEKDNTLIIKSYEVTDPSWGTALLIASRNNIKNRSDEKDKYTVSCANGDKEWSKGCSGKFSCGSLIYQCLQEGGCSTICETPAEVEYYPEEDIFIISTEEKDMDNVIELTSPK